MWFIPSLVYVVLGMKPSFAHVGHRSSSDHFVGGRVGSKLSASSRVGRYFATELSPALTGSHFKTNTPENPWLLKLIIMTNQALICAVYLWVI